MEDYLERQINQMTRILAKLLASLLGLKKRGSVNVAIEITNQTLKNELDFNTDELIAIKTEDLIDFLVKEKKFNLEHIEKLAEILLLIADDVPEEKKGRIYERCLIMYEYIEKTDITFSFDRRQKIEKIKNSL